jgi:hypothetical protein
LRFELVLNTLEFAPRKRLFRKLQISAAAAGCAMVAASTGSFQFGIILVDRESEARGR